MDINLVNSNYIELNNIISDLFNVMQLLFIKSTVTTQAPFEKYVYSKNLNNIVEHDVTMFYQINTHY